MRLYLAVEALSSSFGYWLSGRTSAANSRESAQIRAESARFRADPANFRQNNFPADSAEHPANVRRTPAESTRIRRGWICADSATNWRKSSLKKCPLTKTSLTPRFPTEKLWPRTSFGRGNKSRVRVRVRAMVL